MNTKEIIELLISKLSDVDFALLGSLNLKFQGVSEIEPRDIDFLTDDQGIKEVSRIFDSKIFKDNEDEYLETIFEIDNIEVHFVSNNSNSIRPINFMDYVVNVKKYGIDIPCMSLKSELEAYKKMNREKDKVKIDLIEKYLEKTHNFE